VIKNVALPCAGEYHLLEGEAYFELELGINTDPLAKDRIDFREHFFNEFVFRIADSIYKIKLVTDALHEHNEYKATKFSALVTLENQLLDDALSYNLLELSEIIETFAKEFPVNALKFASIFKISQWAEQKLTPEFLKKYNLSFSSLFPRTEEINEAIQKNKFKNISKKINKNAKQLFTLRNKVLAHKYDPMRFDVYLSFQEYLKIADKIMKILDEISVVVSFRSNDWDSFHPKSEHDRVKNWLVSGLLASL
jgi:hypothetical protein